MMFKWLARKINKAQREIDRLEGCEVAVASTGSSRNFDGGLNFSIFRADGGHVVEVRQYDRKTDRNNNSLHVITDDKDLGEELGKIVVFQNLRS
jgi:hypothetical protein